MSQTACILYCRLWKIPQHDNNFFQVVRNEKLWLEFIVYMRLPSCLLSCLWKFASRVGVWISIYFSLHEIYFFTSLSLLSLSVNEFKSSFCRNIKKETGRGEMNEIVIIAHSPSLSCAVCSTFLCHLSHLHVWVEITWRNC